MYETYYLLSVAKLINGSLREREQTEVTLLDAIDSHRKAAAERIKNHRKRAQSLAASLLLQAAVRDYERAKEGVVRSDERKESETPSESIPGKTVILTLSDLLSEKAEVIDLKYTFGPYGKPYFKDVPLFFNISHSGDYVFLAVSEEEIGADIQKTGGSVDVMKVERYFTEGERTHLERLSGEARKQVFYRMWCAKEAYGKLTGEGIGAALSLDVEASGNIALNTAFWPEGYCTAVCRRKTNEEIIDLPEGL